MKHEHRLTHARSIHTYQQMYIISTAPGQLAAASSRHTLTVDDALASLLSERYTIPMVRHDGGAYYDHMAIVKVLVPVSVFGWLVFGVICILCINGKGRAGRWIPEWYLDSDGTRWDKAAVGAWWLIVVIGWPVILPAIALSSVSRRLLGKCCAERRSKKEGEEEEAAAADAGQAESVRG